MAPHKSHRLLCHATTKDKLSRADATRVPNGVSTKSPYMCGKWELLLLPVCRIPRFRFVILLLVSVRVGNGSLYTSISLLQLTGHDSNIFAIDPSPPYFPNRSSCFRPPSLSAGNFILCLQHITLANQTQSLALLLKVRILLETYFGKETNMKKRWCLLYWHCHDIEEEKNHVFQSAKLRTDLDRFRRQGVMSYFLCVEGNKLYIYTKKRNKLRAGEQLKEGF